MQGPGEVLGRKLATGEVYIDWRVEEEAEMKDQTSEAGGEVVQCCFKSQSNKRRQRQRQQLGQRRNPPPSASVVRT